MKAGTHIMLKRVFWTVLIAGLGVLCLSAIDFKKNMSLQGINIELAGFDEDRCFMKPADLENEILKLIGPLDKHTVGDISCDIIEQELAKNPFIANVEVFVSGNAKLTARITQREPVMRVISEGQNFYLDKEGIRVPVSQYYTPRVHVLTGSLGAKNANEILPVVLALRDNSFMDALIEQIHYDSKDNIILIPGMGRTQILFGNTERIEDKFEQIQAFYTDIIADGGWDKYSTIDLRFRDQIICKKNPTS